MICPHCGKQIHGDSLFCTYCGSPVNRSPYTASQPYKPVMNTANLIMSIINIIFVGCSCPNILFGGAALVFTILASSARNAAEEETYTLIAKVINIVGLAVLAITLLIFLMYIAIFSVIFVSQVQVY